MTLRGKHILIGITGSIAAYKSAMLIRLLVKEGAEVKVIMTPLAKEFITPLTIATLTKNPILVDFFDPENGSWNSHVDLGLWADIYLIAPATANSLAKMANGIADNLLLTSYLSARCPVVVAPAMDLDMFCHPTTTQNLKTLQARGVQIIEPSTGALASGLDGKGRMEEPETILRIIIGALTPGDFQNKKILITAGPTYEPIDPVRFIGNHSSGKMGYALAEELAMRGAEVILVSGPTGLTPKHPAIQRINVQTASEMNQVAGSYFPKVNVAIMAAAVSDFTPENTAAQKIKNKQNISLQLCPTQDIAAGLGQMKQPDQVLVGFALETENETENATQKLARKNLDFIVLNSLKDAGAGFGHATNKVTIIDTNNQILSFDLKNKAEVAKDIADKLVTYFNNEQ